MLKHKLSDIKYSYFFQVKFHLESYSFWKNILYNAFSDMPLFIISIFQFIV